MRWTPEDLAEYMAKVDQSQPDTPDDGPESRLQQKCLKWCEHRGIPVFHDWSRKRNTAGWPDLFIFAEGGRVILVELKAGGGRLSQDQVTLRHMLKFNGHEVHIVRSYRRFLEVMADMGDDIDKKSTRTN